MEFDTYGVSICPSVRPSRWSQFRDLVDQKKDSLSSALGVQNYHLECNETKSWIKEKTKVPTAQQQSAPTVWNPPQQQRFSNWVQVGTQRQRHCTRKKRKETGALTTAWFGHWFDCSLTRSAIAAAAVAVICSSWSQYGTNSTWKHSGTENGLLLADSTMNSYHYLPCFKVRFTNSIGSMTSQHKHGH